VLLGTAAALKAGYSWSWVAAVALLIFTFPANLFIYGINDLFDQETDRLNPKKQGYETLLDPRQTKRLLWTIVLSLAPGIVLLLFLPQKAFIAFLVFLFLGAFYSAPPIRAKARPFLDALFNVLYLLPALVAWYAFGGRALNWSLVVAGMAWCMAMHAYSAVPDIAADEQSHLQTVATVLGKRLTLLFCAALYLVSALVAFLSIGPLALVIGGVYLVLMGLSACTVTSAQLFRYYRWFPWVNSLVGFGLFWWMILR
jgi:4-hydroxybenzoate polyprenyltransferase